MVELCEHSDCGFGGRLEYCKRQPELSATYARASVDILDTLTRYGGIKSENFHFSADGSGSSLERTFLYHHVEEDYDGKHVVPRKIAIQHIYDRKDHMNVYDFSIATRGIALSLQEASRRSYLISSYVTGKIEGEISAFDFVGGQRESREMTPYDHFILVDELESVMHALKLHKR